MSGPRILSATVERFAIAGSFTISRGSRTEAIVVVATIWQGGVMGRGECVPYARYGETVDGVMAAICEQAPAIAAGLTRHQLLDVMRPGAARNALDCALWDLEAKISGVPARIAAGLPELSPVTTAFTLSLGTPDAMADAACAAADRPLLKIKLGGAGDPERLRAVRAAAPRARLIVDANEAWSPGDLTSYLAECAAAGVELVEQPLPAGADDALLGRRPGVAVCADESLHDRTTLPVLVGKYDAINIKLDKAGGLTEALLLAADAERLGLQVMVGCMVGTSLAMAPAMLLAQRAAVVDLDGPLLLRADREPGLTYRGSTVLPPGPELWG